MKFNIDDARKLLTESGIFYGEIDDDPNDAQTINFNDTWGWATAWGDYVEDNELPELARLSWLYGWCGVLYWGSQKNKAMRSEFYHYNRMIEFVEHEEALIKKYPSESKRAYHKTSYKIRGGR